MVNKMESVEPVVRITWVVIVGEGFAGWLLREHVVKVIYYRAIT